MSTAKSKPPIPVIVGALLELTEHVTELQHWLDLFSDAGYTHVPATALPLSDDHIHTLRSDLQRLATALGV